MASETMSSEEMSIDESVSITINDINDETKINEKASDTIIDATSDATNDATSDATLIENNSTEPIDIDFFRNLTLSAKDKKKNRLAEEFNNSMKEAILDITDGCYEKMKLVAEKGQSRCDLKGFTWEDKREATHDSNGSKIIYGKVRAKDLIDPYKYHDKFMPLLNDFFNKDLSESDNKFNCGYKRTQDKTTGQVIWTIFVSWLPYEKRIKETEGPTFFRAGRGGGGGRNPGMGGRGGRGSGRGHSLSSRKEDENN